MIVFQQRRSRADIPNADWTSGTVTIADTAVTNGNSLICKPCRDMDFAILFLKESGHA
jgi:hypothetical protein